MDEPASTEAETGDGDGETTGDATGDGDGDGDGEATGDGDGEPSEHWCDICNDPSDGASCEVNAALDQSVRFHANPGLYDIDLNETCTVVTVSPTLIRLDCQTNDPEISLDLDEPWTPTLAVDEVVHLVADGLEMDLIGLVIDWRIERADTSLALASRQAFGVFDSLGLGAIELTVEHDLCTPVCGSDVVFEQVGMTFEFQGEQATLFKGGHALVGDREIWIVDAHHLVCEAIVQYAYGSGSVFVSAVP